MSNELEEAIQKIKECNIARQNLIQDEVVKVALSDTIKGFILATVKLDNSIDNSVYGFKNGLTKEQDESNQRILAGDFSGSLVA